MYVSSCFTGINENKLIFLEEVVMKKVVEFFLSVIIFCSLSTQTLSENSCEFLADGYYETGPCMNVYMLCRNKLRKFYECPKNYVFDGRYKMCAPPEQLPNCNPMNTVLRYDWCGLSTQSSNNLREIQPCDTQYGTCYGKTLVLNQCEIGKVFSGTVNRCVLPQENNDCQVQLKLDNQFDLTSYCNKYSKGVPVVPLGKCTRDLLVCNHERPYLAQCFPGEIFEPVSKMCLPKHQVPRCNIDREAFYDRWQVGRPAESFLDGNVVEQQQLDNVNFCNGRRDGIYYNQRKNDDCLNEIAVCRKNVLEKRSCQYGYSFDKTFQFCIPDSRCNFVDEQFQKINLDGVKELASDICSDNPDGFYAMGDCTPFFTVCVKSEGVAYYCPPGTVFKDATSDCVPFVDEKSCHPPKETQKKIDVTLNLCDGINNGLIGFAGCHNTYVSCVDGNPVEHRCQEKYTVFDAVKKQCVHEEDHRDCPNFRKRKPVLLPIETVLSYDVIPSKCTNHGEFKNHSTNCRKFIRCNHGKYVVFDCPPKTIFVLSISVCDHEANYNAC